MTKLERFLSVAAVILSAVGVTLAIILVRESLEVYQGGVLGGFFCGGGGRFDCNQVASHPSAWLLGVPLAAWGLAYYILMMAASVWNLGLDERGRAAARSLGVALAGAAVVFDGYLLYIMVTQIGAICLLCVSTYVVNVLLLVTFWTLNSRTTARSSWASLFVPPKPAPQGGGGSRWLRLAVITVAVVGVSLAFMLPALSARDTHHNARLEAIDFLQRMRDTPDVDMARFDSMPSRGPANAKVVIAAASDFQCSFCRSVASQLEGFRAKNPNDIRIIFLNSPLNSECNPAIPEEIHPDACWLAKLAICAEKQGKFWNYHDYLYDTMPFPKVNAENVEKHLADIGLDIDQVRTCMEDAETDSVLSRQVALSRELRLTSTPSLVINGHAKRGGVYPFALASIVRTLLLVDSVGVATNVP